MVHATSAVRIQQGSDGQHHALPSTNVPLAEVRILGALTPEQAALLTPDVLKLLALLHHGKCSDACGLCVVFVACAQAGAGTYFSLFLSQKTELEPRRQGLLLERTRKALEIDGGVLPHFLEETRAIREDPTWKCAPIPADIQVDTY